MKIVKNIRKSGEYTVELPGFKFQASIFKDGDGVDWREHHKDFKEHTWKLMLDDTGMIRSRTKIVDALTPYEDETCHIVEVEEKELPSNFFDPGMFIMWSWFEGHGVVRRKIPDEENLETNKVMKSETLKRLREALEPLYLADKHGIMTDEESELKDRLEKKMILTNRIDPNNRDIVWATAD